MSEPVIANKGIIEHTFSEAAPTYNRIAYFTEFGAHLAELIPITDGVRILDIATGTGAVLIPAARRVGLKGRVTGIDLSNEMLEQTKKAAAADGLHNVDLLKMDAENLEFPDSTFDVVTCGFGIFFLPDMNRGLDEIYRVLKKGGHIALTVIDKTLPNDRFLSAAFRKLSAEYGVEVKLTNQSAFTPEEVRSLLTRNNFQSCKISQGSRENIWAGVEEYWEILLSAANRATIMNMDEDTRARFKKEFFEKISPFKKPDGFHSPVGVIYAIAQK